MPNTVYFCTNRVCQGNPIDPAQYGNQMTPPGTLVYGRAFVADPAFPTDSAGGITTLDLMDWCAPKAPDFGDVWQGNLPLVIFIHGFDNSFADAITRAAFIQAWYGRDGAAWLSAQPGATAVKPYDFNIVAFSWPSDGTAVSFPFLIRPYLDDEAASAASAGHIAQFINRISGLVAAQRKAGQPVTLLCHSMGNRALAETLEVLFATDASQGAIFDHAILAAADEPSTSFAEPGKRLNTLSHVADRIAVLFSQKDLVLRLLSNPVNNGVAALTDTRLGEDGPDNKDNAGLFPPAIYEFIDCSNANDFNTGFLESHQYYRRSPSARASVISFITKDGAAAIG